MSNPNKESDMKEKLISFLSQLSEMNDYIQSCEDAMVLVDPIIENNIQEAMGSLSDTAHAISIIIGRETLNVGYYGMPTFNFEKKGGKS